MTCARSGGCYWVSDRKNRRPGGRTALLRRPDYHRVPKGQVDRERFVRRLHGKDRRFLVHGRPDRLRVLQRQARQCARNEAGAGLQGVRRERADAAAGYGVGQQRRYLWTATYATTLPYELNFTASL